MPELSGVSYQENNYESAWTICAGARLCTKRKLGENYSATECEFNGELIWSSTTGSPKKAPSVVNLVRLANIPSMNHTQTHSIVPTTAHSIIPTEVHSIRPSQALSMSPTQAHSTSPSQAHSLSGPGKAEANAEVRQARQRQVEVRQRRSKEGRGRGEVEER